MSLSTLDTRSLRKSMASRNESPRRLTLTSLALAAIILTTITAVLTMVTAASLFLASLSFRALAIISVLLNVAALAALVLFLIQVVWRRDERWYSSRRSRVLLLSLYSSPLFLASLLTLVTYGLTQSHIDAVEAKDSEASSDLMAAKFAVWALSTLTQAIFVVATVRWLPLVPGTSNTNTSSESGQEMREQSPPMTLDLKDDRPIDKDLASPTFSTETVQSSRNSWRSSLQHVVRPITSRTRLLSKVSSLRESGSFHSGNTTRTNSMTHSDGFETWDTSSVDQQTRDIAMQATSGQDMLKVFGPGRGTRLDPIPGSRPVSPARALDGPFPSSPAVELEDLEDLPAPTPAFMTNSPHTSRPITPTNIDDANVHPLFRSDSPHPPPAATPGTVVVASPYSGQVIQRPPTTRSRANSRTRGQGPYYDGQSIRSNASMRSLRSPSPPAREITPPVPEFILCDSPRVSTGSLRKVSLYKEGDQ